MKDTTINLPLPIEGERWETLPKELKARGADLIRAADRMAETFENLYRDIKRQNERHPTWKAFWPLQFEKAEAIFFGHMLEWLTAWLGVGAPVPQSLLDRVKKLRALCDGPACSCAPRSVRVVCAHCGGLGGGS